MEPVKNYRKRITLLASFLGLFYFDFRGKNRSDKVYLTRDGKLVKIDGKISKGKKKISTGGVHNWISKNLK